MVDTASILREVKANLAKLESCTKHRFHISERYDSGWPKAFTCDHCGGTVRSDFVRAYSQGYAAHGGDITDVFPEAYIKLEQV